MMKEESMIVNLLKLMDDYDFYKFDRMVEILKSHLLKMDSKKKMKVVNRMIRFPLTKKGPDHKDRAAKSLKKQKRPALLPATAMSERSEGEKIKPSVSKKTSVTSPEDQVFKAEEAMVGKKQNLVLRFKLGAKRPHAEIEDGKEEENANKTTVVALFVD